MSPDGRSESAAERLDRHWAELLQELRVAQTGVQILAGFMLALPFQHRFVVLSDAERVLYLCTVSLSVVSAVLLLAPVAIHRVMFRAKIRDDLVELSDRFAKLGLAALALALICVMALIFGVVVGVNAAVTAGILLAIMLVASWWLLPTVIRARARGNHEHSSRSDASSD